MSQDPRIEAAALEDATDVVWSRSMGEIGVCCHDRERDDYKDAEEIAKEAITAYLAAADNAATITTVEGLDALQVGTLVMCANVNPTWPAVFLHTGSKRDPWLALDPSDRDDGETTLDSGTVLTWHGKGTARVVHWGTE